MALSDALSSEIGRNAFHLDPLISSNRTRSWSVILKQNKEDPWGLLADFEVNGGGITFEPRSLVLIENKVPFFHIGFKGGFLDNERLLGQRFMVENADKFVVLFNELGYQLKKAEGDCSPCAVEVIEKDPNLSQPSQAE